MLVNVVNALRVLSENAPENQRVIGESNAIPTIIELVGMFCILVAYVLINPCIIIFGA